MHPILRFCAAHEITQAEFAERLGVSTAHMSLVVNGKRSLSWDAADRVVQVTGGEITLADLAAWNRKARAA